MTGDGIVVGAPHGDDAGSESGSVYVFVPNESGGQVQQAKLTAEDAAADDYFGNSVAVAENRSWSAPTAPTTPVPPRGRCIRADESGGYSQQAKLTASDAAAGDRFGSAVGVAGDTIVVSAYGDDDAGDRSGSAYVYRPATPVVPVVPPAPSGPTCAADGVFNPPVAQVGVVWSVDPADQTGPGSYVVTAAPAAGYYVPAGAQSIWMITVAAQLTEGCVPPVPPVVIPPEPPVPTVSVRAVFGGMRLFVNVNPNKGREYWQFTVQMLVKGKWRTRSKVDKTWGKYETRRLRLSRGTYRVMVLPRYGYAGATSEAVSLRSAPATVAHPDRGVAASVKVRAVSGRSKLHVNVNPNMGRGYWQFAVQKHSKGEWRALSKVYKTYRRGETRRLNLRRGKYRVIVMSRYGYDEVMSDTVWLRR